MNYNHRFLPAAQVEDYTRHLKLCNWKMTLYLLGVGCGSISYGYSYSASGLGIKIYLEGGNENEPLFWLLNYIFQVGGVFGAIACGYSCNYGRRSSINIGAGVLLLFTAILPPSVNLAMYMVIRFLQGFGATMMLVAIPVWTSEISPPRGRAILVGLHPVLISFGICIPRWIALPTSHGDISTLALKRQIWIGCTFPLLCYLSTWYLPESPRQRLKEGKEEKAWKLLNDLHANQENGSQYYVQLEFEHMRRQIDVERAAAANTGAHLGMNSTGKRVGIAVVLNLCAVSSGAYAISLYDNLIWIRLGYVTESGDLDYVASALRENAISTTVAGFGLFALLIVERIPRRAFIGIGYLGCLVTLAGQTGLYASFGSFYTPTITSTTGSAAIALSYVWVLFYGAFVYNASFIYVVEIFPHHLRAKGVAFALMAYGLAEVLWRAVGPYALPAMDWRYCIFFLVSNVVACLVAFICPDTRNMPLEDIGRLFGDGPPTNNMWPQAQPMNPNQYAPMAQQPYYPHWPEVEANHRVEMDGMRPPAEAAGPQRYEMPHRYAPGEAGGANLYEFPAGSVHSRGGSRGF